MCDERRLFRGRTGPVFILMTHALFAALGSLLINTSVHAQNRSLIAKCLSIQNVDDRVNCLESGGTTPDTSQPQPPSNARRVGPSFDCRAAAQSIERAICGDPTLSEWDARMGQQYQQAFRARKPNETQALVDQQRSWIQQRNNTCGAVAGTAVWSCVLDMTRQRIAALAEPLPTTNPPPAPQPAPTFQPPLVPPPSRGQNEPRLSATVTPQATPMPSATPNPISSSSGSASEGPNPLLVILFVVGAIVGGVAVFRNIQARARRQRLVANYGEEIAERILAKQVWQGMTNEQLIESWGSPADRDYEVKKTNTKETWKYGQTGKNRFSNRVYLENGIVVGWKQ